MKVDMTTSRTVTKEQGASLARSLGARFMEVSAKTGEGVEQAFFTLARLKLPLVSFEWFTKGHLP